MSTNCSYVTVVSHHLIQIGANVRLYALLLAGILCAQGAHATPTTSFGDELKRYLSTPEGREVVGKAVFKYQEEMEAQEAQADLEERIKNPVKIDVGASPVKGPSTAKITIVEFSDFECPYCKEASEALEVVLKRYPQDVRLAFKHLPLPFHQQATPAAVASLAAHRQGKFWEYHDKLFGMQEELSSASFEKIAKDLQLDLLKFKQDMESPELKKMVKDDADLAAELQIEGTPALFVNGVQFSGVVPPEELSNIIERLMKPS